MDGVGVEDSSTNRLGSSVVEYPACDGVVPGSIPGLAFVAVMSRGNDKTQRVRS